MSETKKKNVKTPDAVEMVKTTTAAEVVNKPKPGKLVKGSPEAKARMAEVRECYTPDSIQKGAETRQRTYAFRNAFEKALKMDYQKPYGDIALFVWNNFRHNGLGSYADAIAIAATIKAANGDIEAAKFMRDTLGEKPVEDTNHSGNITVTISPTIKEWAE